jgi:hypothetical protein
MTAMYNFKLLRSAPLWVSIGIAVIVILVFWQQAFRVGTFIGESDRLNSYLNMRLWEYDAYAVLHQVPSWNPTMFGGFPASALHWMNPGTDPIALLLRWFSRPELFEVLGYVSIALVIAACFLSYLYFYELVGDHLVAALGGVTYGLSVISLHRISQVDNAHFTFLALPLAFFVLRRLKSTAWSFVALALTLTALTFWGFLQEVAYTFFILGFYTLYRAAILWRADRAKAVNTIFVFTSASFVSILFATPRLLGVAQEMSLVARTSSMQYYGYRELLRFFHEGVFGRTFEENRLLGNGMNLHEGLQLSSSTAAAVIVCLGILRPKSRSEFLGAILFGALLATLIRALQLGHEIGPFSATFVSISIWVGILTCVAAAKIYWRQMYSFLLLKSKARYSQGRDFDAAVPSALDLPPLTWIERLLARSRRLLRGADFCKADKGERPLDTAFHIYALVLLLFAIVTSEGYRIVYLLFGRIDFTHSRLSVVMIFSFSSLFCIYLNEVRLGPFFGKIAAPSNRLRLLSSLLAMIFFGAAAWLINGSDLDAVGKSATTGLWRSGGEVLLDNVVIKMVITAIVVSTLCAISLLQRGIVQIDGMAGISVAAWVLIETITYAHFKVEGPQTWTFPVPFRGFNYLNVPTNAMRPPSPQKLATFASDFETDKYKAVLSGGNVKFAGSKTAHISSFWQMNSVGGYGTGVPDRLAMLPWPPGVQSLRTIEFQEGMVVDPAVLALLNVKYFVELTTDLYFNVVAEDPQQAHDAIDPRSRTHTIEGRQIRYVENPVAPLPRQFLASSVIGTLAPPPFRQRKEETVRNGSESNPDKPESIIYGDRLQDLIKTSFVEGLSGTHQFDAQGPLDVQYRGDEISIQVEPSTRERFVVLNMRYHPDWRVKLDDREVRPFPTNLTMMGVRLPPGSQETVLRFQPFSTRIPARLIELLAVLCFLMIFVFFARNNRIRQAAEIA